MPEFVVSTLSAFQGNSDVAIGNVIGSNIFNTLAILGITSLLAPVALTKTNIKWDIPMGIFASIVLLIMTSDVFLGDGTIDMIGRGEGILLLFCFAGFMTYSFLTAKNIPETEIPENASTKKRKTDGLSAP